MPRDKTRKSRRKSRGAEAQIPEKEALDNIEPLEITISETPVIEPLEITISETPVIQPRSSHELPPQGEAFGAENGSNSYGSTGFGLVNPDLQHYFKKLESAIDSKEEEGISAEIIENLDLFVEGAFEEMKGKEFQLSVDHECSRVLEKLLCIAPSYRVTYMLNMFSENILALMAHRFSSHVVQAMFVLSAKIIDSEVEGVPLDIPEEISDDFKDLPKMSEVIMSIVKTLEGRWSELSFDQFASHPLRVLLQVLHGAPFSSSDGKPVSDSLIKSKRSKDYMNSKSSKAFSAIELKGTYKTPASFADTLENSISRELVLDANELTIRTAIFHPSASPFLQLILLLQKPESRDQFVDKLLLGVPSEATIALKGAELRKPMFYTMLKDPVGSHLLEIIIGAVSSGMFHRLYLLYFRGRLEELSAHMASNHVVQKLLINVHTEAQLNMILSELISFFGRLLKIGRSGVIRSTLDACLRVNSGYKEVIKGLAQAFLANTPSEQLEFVHLALRLQTYETYTKNLDTRPKYQIHGSLILQSLLDFPEPHNSLAVASLLAQPQDVLLNLCKDPISCRFVEKFLMAPLVGLKAKRKALAKFTGVYHLLAMDKCSSWILEKCWIVSDIAFKEKIAMELVQNERQLLENFFGKFAYKTCKIETFKHKKEEWKQITMGSDRKKDMFKDIIGDNTVKNNTPTKANIPQKVLHNSKEHTDSNSDLALPSSLDDDLKDTLNLLSSEPKKKKKKREKEVAEEAYPKEKRVRGEKKDPEALKALILAASRKGLQ